MGWIKRNLLFVIGGAVALALLGGAGLLIWQGFSHNSDKSTTLNELYDKLNEIANAPQKPGDDKTDNIKAAKEQDKQVQDWIALARQYFKPIEPILPGENLSSAAYGDALRHTIDQLQHEAEGASVTLPPKYQFSFSAQCSLARFAPGSLEPLAQQLAEVKAISEVLFAARVNAFDSIQRVRVSEDDKAGLQSDYIEEQSVTNDLAVITPYVVTFRTFTPELARVITGFATSPNPFIIKSISAQPAGGAATETAAGTPATPYAPYARAVPGMDPRYYRGGMAPNPEQVQPQPGVQATPRGVPQTVLKEQKIRFTVEVEIVKLLPKS